MLLRCSCVSWPFVPGIAAESYRPSRRPDQERPPADSPSLAAVLQGRLELLTDHAQRHRLSRDSAIDVPVQVKTAVGVRASRERAAARTAVDGAIESEPTQFGAFVAFDLAV